MRIEPTPLIMMRITRLLIELSFSRSRKVIPGLMLMRPLRIAVNVLRLTLGASVAITTGLERPQCSTLHVFLYWLLAYWRIP